MSTHKQFFFFILPCYFLATVVVLGYLKNCFRELSFRNGGVLSPELLSCCPVVLGQQADKSLAVMLAFTCKAWRDSEVLLETIILDRELNVKGKLTIKYEVVSTCSSILWCPLYPINFRFWLSCSFACSTVSARACPFGNPCALSAAPHPAHMQSARVCTPHSRLCTVLLLFHIPWLSFSLRRNWSCSQVMGRGEAFHVPGSFSTWAFWSWVC